MATSEKSCTNKEKMNTYEAKRPTDFQNYRLVMLLTKHGLIISLSIIYLQ